MKKILAVFLLLTTIVTAQTAEKKVWDLLLANKRDDARKLFDKELKSKVASNINYFILDNFIFTNSVPAASKWQIDPWL